MNIELYNKNGKNSLIQIFKNRKIREDEISKYINTTDEVINSPKKLGEEAMIKACKTLFEHIQSNDEICIVVDCDCDGFCSSAILINWLHKVFPFFTENKIKYFLHEGKQHGLADCQDYIKNFKLVIVPDAGSNDFEIHKELKNQGIDIIILDHHDADHISEDAIVINSQFRNYPNPYLSGAGVTWQFCRFLDEVLNTTYANNFIDLCALGEQGDMMSIINFETKHIIFKGFKEKNIKNPFIKAISNKNAFSLNKSDYNSFNELAFSPIGASFFIVPFVNAINRCGTIEEKTIVFNSMIEYMAEKEILSNKRGHSLGEKEKLVEQAMRVCTNVKNRQTKKVDEAIPFLKDLIKKYNLLEHKVLLFLIDDEIEGNILGLCANKIMAEYQRPTCILKKYIDEEGKISYRGSARGCDIIGVTDFKSICSEAPGTIYAEGHPGAFGLGLGYDYQEDTAEINGDWLCHFYDFTDEKLKNMLSEPRYFIDFLWEENTLDSDLILAIAHLNNFIGKDFERPLIGISATIDNNNFTVMKSNTLKFDFCNNVKAIKFSGTEEEIEKFSNEKNTVLFICKCAANEWNGNVTPQLQIVDYEIQKIEKKNISEIWNF